MPGVIRIRTSVTVLLRLAFATLTAALCLCGDLIEADFFVTAGHTRYRGIRVVSPPAHLLTRAVRVEIAI